MSNKGHGPVLQAVAARGTCLCLGWGEDYYMINENAQHSVSVSISNQPLTFISYGELNFHTEVCILLNDD